MNAAAIGVALHYRDRYSTCVATPLRAEVAENKGKCQGSL
jgi:hypothetical protein